MNQVESILDEATPIASKIELAAARGAGYAQIAAAWLKLGNPTRCLAILAGALDACEKIKYPEEKAKRLAWIARLYQAAGDNLKAREQFARAVRLAAAAETVSKKVAALYDIACEYVDAGLGDEAAKALAMLRATLAGAEKEVDVACELINIAELYIEINQIATAKEILDEAARLTAQNQAAWFKIERWIEIAEALANAGDSGPAEARLTESLAALDSVDKESRPYFHLKIADLYIVLGRRSAALELLPKIAGEADPNESSYLKAGSLTEIAAQYLRLDEQPAAADCLNAATQEAEKIEDIKDKIAILVQVGGLLVDAGHQEKASGLAEQSQVLAGSLIEAKSRLFGLGSVAVLWAKLKEKEKVRGIVTRLEESVRSAPGRTGGLGAIVEDLADAGQTDSALILALLVREPEIKVSALCRVAEDMLE